MKKFIINLAVMCSTMLAILGPVSAGVNDSFIEERDRVLGSFYFNNIFIGDPVHYPYNLAIYVSCKRDQLQTKSFKILEKSKIKNRAIVKQNIQNCELSSHKLDTDTNVLTYAYLTSEPKVWDDMDQDPPPDQTCEITVTKTLDLNDYCSKPE